MPSLRFVRGQLPERREGPGYFFQGPTDPYRLYGAPSRKESHLSGHAGAPEIFRHPHKLGGHVPEALSCTRRRLLRAVLRPICNPGARQASQGLRARSFPFEPRPGAGPNRPSGLRAAFFVGCMTDKVYPGIGHAVLSALEHNGVGILMPEDQGCCGIPALASGGYRDFSQARSVQSREIPAAGLRFSCDRLRHMHVHTKEAVAAICGVSQRCGKVAGN